MPTKNKKVKVDISALSNIKMPKIEKDRIKKEILSQSVVNSFDEVINPISFKGN